jgi:heme A synthase
LAAVQLISIFFINGEISKEDAMFHAVVCIVVAVIFAGLAFWTKRKPFTAILTALIVYAALVLLTAVLDPSTLLQGLFLKIAAFVLLGVSLSNAREVQKWLDEVNKK